MNQLHHEKYNLPEIDPDADEQFGRSPQILSVVTLVLGLLSFLALFKTMFWVFPVVAAVLAMVSLVSLARNPERIGRKAALIGLLLAVFFGSWSASRYFSRQQWLYGLAREKAGVWLDLVKENRLREAHQLHLRFDQRAREGTTLDEFYADREITDETVENFFESPPLNQFVKIAPEATVKLMWLEAYEVYGDNDDIVLRYMAEYEKAGRPKELEMLLRMRRTINPRTGECGWSVYLVKDPYEERA